MENEPGDSSSGQRQATWRRAFVALGSNLGDRRTVLASALRALGDGATLRVQRVSSFHETDAVGGPEGQERYLNAVAEVETTLAPRALLELLQRVEAAHGRIRTVRDGPRTLDLDLLVYEGVRMADAELTLPHPRMWERAFVMEPLAELCDIDVLRRTWLSRGG